MIKYIKRISLLASLLIVLSLQTIYAMGYNINFELDTGISEALFGTEVDSNKQFWQDLNNYYNYINMGGAISVDVVLKQKFSIIAGIQFKNIQLNYNTIQGNEYGNDTVQISYPILQLPIMAKYNFVIKKTTEIIDSFNLAGGINISNVIGQQTYKDSMTNYVGNFIKQPINIGFIARATYSHKLGPGNVFAGIKADINFITQGYIISGHNVNYGNVLVLSPVIGYTFILKEDKGLAKITEKNKRIKDIDVQ